MSLLADGPGEFRSDRGATRAPCPRRALLFLLPLLLALFPGCTRGATPTRVPQIEPTPVTGLVGSLVDEQSDLPDGRVAWRTHWQLCWTAYSGATAYELEVRTGEGPSPQLRQQQETCFRIEAAAGEDTKTDLSHSRRTLLAMQSGQLAYRVRAVLGPGRVSAWSAALAVGTEGAPP
jgi:hypothetical protein